MHDENISDELTTLATRTEPKHNTKYKKHNFTVKTTMLLFKNIIIVCVGLSFKFHSHKTSIQPMIMTMRHIHRQYYTHCDTQPSTKLSLEFRLFSFNSFFFAAGKDNPVSKDVQEKKNHERKWREPDDSSPYNSSPTNSWNSELCFETKHRAHNSKTVHKQAENKRRTFIGQLVIN